MSEPDDASSPPRDDHSANAGPDGSATPRGGADTEGDGTAPPGDDAGTTCGLDRHVVEVLTWILDTETRALIYAVLRRQPHATSEEVADRTGLYPSTVREALADLADDGVVTRRKRRTGGAGNDPYEYAAVPPRDLVCDAAESLQGALNDVFRIGDGGAPDDPRSDDGPVRIQVRDADGAGAGAED